MAELVIADTSCLIVLSKIGRLLVLHSLYSNITITPEIKQEFGADLPEWVNVSSETEYQKLLQLALVISNNRFIKTIMM
jgi:predicted nucleic acid-binding protein